MRAQTRFVLLAALALAVVLAAVLVFVFGSREHVAQVGATPTLPPASEPRTEAPPLEGRVELGSGPIAAPSTQFPLTDSVERRFDGTGRLTIYAFATEGAVFPEHWLLSIEPSKVLVAGERATSHQFTFDHGEREYTLEALQLGGYAIRAFANGLCAKEQHLVLAKPEDVNVVAHVVFYPAGYVTGRVVDENGQPIDGVGIVLEARESHERRATTTDPAGAYRFETVLDGEYTVFVGEPDNPLARGRELAFEAPSLHLSDIQVPVLGEIAIQVVDRAGKPVPNARLEGYGIAGGRIASAADDQGRTLVRFVPAGDATLIATTEDGNQGREKVKLAPGAHADVTIRLRN